MHDQLQRADRLGALAERIGFALWQLQQLEMHAAQCYVLLVQATRGMGVTKGEALLKKAQSKTFGVTVKDLVKSEVLSQDLSARLVALLEERNWLVHRSRADSHGVINSDNATKKLLQRLNSIADEALALLKALCVAAETFARKNGVTREYIDRESATLLEQWQTAADD